MKFLLLNQAFYPDVVATAQVLTDAALALVQRGHEVTVIASRRAYDDATHRFAAREVWQGIQIIRIGTTAFGKGAKWRRAADFASFIVLCGLRLLTVRRPEVVVALTTPPLISFICAVYARLRRARFVYWVMDLNPDEAIAAGWLREGTLAARVLHWMSGFSFRHAQRIIALDKYMSRRIEGKGIAAEKITVLAPGSHDQTVHFDAVGRDRFRQAHGLKGRFVVMYSGNHSPCHPLETLLGAAEELAQDPRFVFLFVGGGSEFRKIRALLGESEGGTNHDSAAKARRASAPGPQLTNVRCLPYQPLNELSASLSAADLHVVVMGNAFVGTIHPCKVYNVLSVGSPILYIGPRPSHMSDILEALPAQTCGAVAHGDVAGCLKEIQRIASLNQRGEPQTYATVSGQYSQQVLLPRLVEQLES